MNEERVSEATKRIADAIIHNDTEGVASVYTDDAKLLSPHIGSISGKKAIKKYWQYIFTNYPVSAFTVKNVSREVLGNTAFEVNTYSMEFKGKKDEGKFVVILKRQADGSWKYAANYAKSQRLQKFK